MDNSGADASFSSTQFKKAVRRLLETNPDAAQAIAEFLGGASPKAVIEYARSQSATRSPRDFAAERLAEKGLTAAAHNRPQADHPPAPPATPAPPVAQPDPAICRQAAVSAAATTLPVKAVPASRGVKKTGLNNHAAQVAQIEAERRAGIVQMQEEARLRVASPLVDRQPVADSQEAVADGNKWSEYLSRATSFVAACEKGTQRYPDSWGENPKEVGGFLIKAIKRAMQEGKEIATTRGMSNIQLQTFCAEVAGAKSYETMPKPERLRVLRAVTTLTALENGAALHRGRDIITRTAAYAPASP